MATQQTNPAEILRRSLEESAPDEVDRLEEQAKDLIANGYGVDQLCIAVRDGQRVVVPEWTQ